MQSCCIVVVPCRVSALGRSIIPRRLGSHKHDWADHVQSVGCSPRHCDFFRVPLAGSPVESLAGVNDMVESSYCLLHWGVPVGSVRVDEVHCYCQPGKKSAT